MKRLRGVLIAALCLLAAVPAAAQNSVAYVDMERLLSEAPQVLSGRTALRDEFETRNQALAEQRTRLSELREQLADEGAFMSAEQRQELQSRVDALAASIEREANTLQDEFNLRLNRELNEVRDRIQTVVTELARERELDLVLTNPVLYADEQVDITDAVLSRLSESFRARREPEE